MNKLTKTQRVSAIIFVFIAFVFWIYVSFIKAQPLVTYSLVLACFVFAISFLRKEKCALYQVLALLFTCVADFFLMPLEGKHKTVAMCAFLIAQVFYAMKILEFSKNKREKLVQIILRVALSVVGAVLVFAILKKQTQALFVISVVYYVNLIVSAVFAFIHFKVGIVQRLTAIGLLLFALCDINIGFDFLIDIFSLGESSFLCKLTSLPINLVHFFYFPSQTILSLSVLFNTSKNLK